MEKLEGHLHQILSPGDAGLYNAGHEAEEVGLLRADELSAKSR